MCKWWAAVFISSLILWNRATPQPVTENIENDRQIRQANNECCPCPTGTAKADDMQSSGTAESAVDQQRSADDCPCMARAADPETSASALVPNTARPLSSLVRPAEPNNEAKPLLHPEVDLASSVLNTLREATDEEYEEAKRRDAAKSNTESEEPDITIAREASGEPTKNIVNIFIKTKESNRDALSEASNIQEEKCAPDNKNLHISMAKEATLEPPSILERLIGVPKFDLASTSKKMVTNEDSSVDSSNVKTSILDINGNSDIFKLKTSPILTNIFSNSFIKTDDSLSGKNANSKQSETIPKITEGLRSPLIPTLKLVPNQNRMRKPDLNLLPSIINENIDKMSKNNAIFKSKPMSGIINELTLPNENSMPLKSVLQFKDIELFSPTKLVPSMSTAKSELPPLPKLGDLFKGFNKKEGEKNHLEFFGNKLIGKTNNNVQVIPKNRPHTEILDTVPSPSNKNEIISDNTCRNEDTLKDTSSTHSPPLFNNIRSNFDETLTSREIYSDEEDEENMPETSKDSVISEKNFNEEEILSESSSDINKNTERKNSRETEDDIEKTSELKTFSPKFQQKSEISRANSNNGDEESSLWKQSEQTNLDSAVAHNEKSMLLSNINEKMEKPVEMGDLLKLSDTMPSASSKTKQEEIIQNKASCDDNSSFDQTEDEEGTTFEHSIESINTFDKESTIDETETDTCANNLNNKATVERNPNEMDVGASEPRISRLSIPNLRSTADDLIDSLNNAILEPSSIVDPDPFNLFRSPSIINLPSMNHIGTRISNILRLNEDRMASSEIGFGNSNANPTISRSRSGSAKTVLPTLNPLEDINLNSFQIKPGALKSREPKIQTPAINMNSYRARLSLPKSLDMKPLKLESTLGNKGGTLETSLKGSPSKLITARKLKSKSSGISNSKNPKLNFSDIKLVDTPRRNSVRLPLESTLPLSSTTDGLRSRAEDAVRSVKASLDSALNKNKKSILGESLNSHNLLQAVASTHDDVQTKLQALHSDFSDRLSSLHSNIFDQTRIPSLRLPQSSILGKSRSSLPSQSIRLAQSSLRKESESSLTHEPLFSRRESQKKDGGSEVNNDKLKLRTTKVTKPIQLELPSASNMMVPRLSSPDKPKSKLALRLEHNLGAQKTHKDRHFKTTPVRESKLSRQTASDPRHVFDANLKNSQPKLLDIDKERSRLGSKLKLSRDTFDSPSEVKQIRILSPIRISSKSANSDDEFCQSDTPTPPRPPILRQKVSAKSGVQTLGIKPPLVTDETKEYEHKSAIENYESINSAPTESTLKQRKPLLMRSKERSGSLLAITAPKQTLDTKSSLLTKMRGTSLNRNNDMSLQPAENSASDIKTPLDDNLKENVNYKCKMVCTKDLL